MAVKETKTAPQSADEAARRFSRRLLGFIRGRVGSRDDAEDLLQEVLIRVTRHERTLATARDPVAWLFAVTRSVIADHYRRAGRPEPVLVGALENDPPTPVAVLSDCVDPLLERLPAKYGDTLRRADLGGETLVALAREEGVSTSALKSRAQRGRKMLREALLSSCRAELDSRGRLVGADTMEKGCC